MTNKLNSHSTHLILVSPSECVLHPWVMTIPPFSIPPVYSHEVPSFHLPPSLIILFHISDRSGGIDWGCDSHGVHGSYLLWADRPDLPHPAHDGGSNPGQHGGPGPAALTVRLHHPGQEAALPARTWIWTHEVCVDAFLCVLYMKPTLLCVFLV